MVEIDFWKTDFAAGGLACAWMTCYNPFVRLFRKRSGGFPPIFPGLKKKIKLQKVDRYLLACPAVCGAFLSTDAEKEEN